MSRAASRLRTALPASSRTAVGATVVGGVLTGLASAPERVGRLFRRRFPMVAVTGMTGVGKSQLVDRLTRRSSSGGVAEVGSAVMERRTRRSARLQGFRFRVVPGDNAATRLGALDEVFHDEPVDGVVHVVANGYATPRRPAGTTGTAVATREDQLAAELEDWTITSHRIASMAVRRDKPIWLVIAVTKADLYPDEVDEAVAYYSPGSGTPFGDKVDALRALAGGAKLSIDVLPVSSEGGDRKSALSAKRAQAMVDALATRLAQLSGHV
ncbi:GTPase domain-containing protein [Nocardioides caldifontis]|uniref:GTPase domain-containing protein n=1 Tax=Nocardioides caldifontis TaxID=2588938 RepID=UPI0011E03DC7|nr:GTPase domain-containing protein [Nocardioides caldifontis]